MAKVAIVTDSTANLPPAITRNLPVYTVPLQVIWGEQSYLDQVDITEDQFYARLKVDKILPTTSQPSPAAFASMYARLI